MRKSDMKTDSKPKVLVVDDVKVNLANIKETLTKNGDFQVATANNGTTALKIAKANKIYLIFLVFLMHYITVFDVCW